jgi:hypothetical protein
MKKRFVIMLGDNATAQQHEAFRLWLKTSYPYLGWWHRVTNTWLLVDLTGGITAAILRDAVMQTFPGVYNMVLEFAANGQSTWAGFGPNTGVVDWFAWIKENWGS